MSNLWPNPIRKNFDCRLMNANFTFPAKRHNTNKIFHALNFPSPEKKFSPPPRKSGVDFAHKIIKLYTFI